MPFKACIFDLDGVVVDTAKYHFLAWRRLARELGFDFSPEHNEQLKGVSRMRSLEILMKIGGIRLSKKEQEEAANRKNSWYVDYITMLTPEEILPGVNRFLTDLKKNQIKTAIGSASKNTGLILQRLELNGSFDAVIDGNKVTKAKPDPEIFLAAARELRVEPSESIVFEDALAGIEAAHRGGMICVGVGDPDLLEQADIIISGFEQLTWERVKTWLSR
jgi:beta-phosphoglucomutase